MKTCADQFDYNIQFNSTTTPIYDLKDVVDIKSIPDHPCCITRELKRSRRTSLPPLITIKEAGSIVDSIQVYKKPPTQPEQFYFYKSVLQSSAMNRIYTNDYIHEILPVSQVHQFKQIILSIDDTLVIYQDVQHVQPVQQESHVKLVIQSLESIYYDDFEEEWEQKELYTVYNE